MKIETMALIFICFKNLKLLDFDLGVLFLTTTMILNGRRLTQNKGFNFYSFFKMI